MPNYLDEPERTLATKSTYVFLVNQERKKNKSMQTFFQQASSKDSLENRRIYPTRITSNSLDNKA
jgi:hypothetical protein